jgi:HEAT repeat.
MAFYDLSKQERAKEVTSISNSILAEIKSGKSKKVISYFYDDDTYIRKAAYQAIGRLYKDHEDLQPKILLLLDDAFVNESHKVRQTVINAAGEIGKSDFTDVQTIFDRGLLDEHHSPRNAVIGSVKKMGEVNPKPILAWAKKYLHHPDKEIRREICHGIELRGRKHPQDILPLLQELQHDKTARVRNTLVHVLGQIAYKEGCLKTVVEHLKGWENATLVEDALEEIIDVHNRYKDFAAMTQAEARRFIDANFYGAKRVRKKSSH